MHRGMQATIEAKQDPGGVDAACHDISQNRQIGHSNATGHHLVLHIPSSAAVDLQAGIQCILEGVDTWPNHSRGLGCCLQPFVSAASSYNRRGPI
ncbi:hypothetical protein J3F84DRAFT_368816 [Trichoderma pleuroticola]